MIVYNYVAVYHTERRVLLSSADHAAAVICIRKVKEDNINGKNDIPA